MGGGGKSFPFPILILYFFFFFLVFIIVLHSNVQGRSPYYTRYDDGGRPDYYPNIIKLKRNSRNMQKKNNGFNC